MHAAIVKQLRGWLLRPSVVHRLPGRLRLRIPALKRLSPEQQDCALLWRDLLATPPQIESVDVNLTSGSALIQYDQNAITEDEVLQYLRSANQFVLRHWDRLAATPADKLPALLKRLKKAAEKVLRQRPILDGDFEVPDDVWV